MSEIAELRKLFQDLIAPDVKSVVTDVAALKVAVAHQFQDLKESMDQQFAGVEGLAQARYIATMAKIETIEATASAHNEEIKKELASMEAVQGSRHESILKALDMDERLERVEARQAAGTAA
jgi:acetyl-CoA carboxylase alpha subunit